VYSQDLLSDDDMDHRIFDDAAQGVIVSNLEEVLVRKPSDIFEVLKKSWERRITGETKMNKQSSRSHTIFTVKVLLSSQDGHVTLLIRVP
jgi:hypothetical protein